MYGIYNCASIRFNRTVQWNAEKNISTESVMYDYQELQLIY